MFYTLANTFSEELAFQEGGINWGADWWKFIIIGFSALLFLFLCVRLALYILRIVGVILCVAFGSAGAWISKLLFTEKLSLHLPESTASYAPALAAFLGFFVCFSLAVCVMMMIRKSAQPLAKKSK